MGVGRMVVLMESFDWCSDGVSRTGAFCALYSVLERVKTEQIVDVFQAVKTLRIQRAGLLGTIVSPHAKQRGDIRLFV